MCRQGLPRVAVLAVFAWVLAFSALFHYHVNSAGSVTTLSSAFQAGTALETRLAASEWLGAAAPGETDCLICALGGVQTGAPATPPGTTGQQSCDPPHAPAAVSHSAAGYSAALPRAPPSPLG